MSLSNVSPQESELFPLIRELALAIMARAAEDAYGTPARTPEMTQEERASARNLFEGEEAESREIREIWLKLAGLSASGMRRLVREARPKQKHEFKVFGL